MEKPRVEAFNERYRPDHGASGPFLAWARKDTLRLLDYEPALFTDFMQSQARASYERGLFRVLGIRTRPSIVGWNGPEGWRADWPEHATRLVVFAYDWMGRLYGLDTSRVLQREPLVARLDPGNGEVFVSDTSFAEFLLADVVHYGDDLMDCHRFTDWLRSDGGRPLRETEFLGYRTPLFVGGRETRANREIVRLEEYVRRAGLAWTERAAEATAAAQADRPRWRGALERWSATVRHEAGSRR